jgi:hypothetical protein
MVVVEKLAKVAHFVPINTIHKETNIAKVYMKEVSKIHGVPKEIVSNKYQKFYFHFLEMIVQGLWNKFKSQYSISPRD